MRSFQTDILAGKVKEIQIFGQIPPGFFFRMIYNYKFHKKMDYDHHE
jgi:hypothetical protein